MRTEQVLVDDPESNITVADQRYIVDDDAIDIGALSHAAWHNFEGIKDYALAVVFGVVGIALVASFSWWSILGLVLLLNPLTVFLPKEKYWLFVFTRDGESLGERSGQKPKFKKEVARGIAEALNAPIRQYRAQHDPRANLEI
jgi:hypothetical protein